MMDDWQSLEDEREWYETEIAKLKYDLERANGQLQYYRRHYVPSGRIEMIYWRVVKELEDLRTLLDAYPAAPSGKVEIPF